MNGCLSYAVTSCIMGATCKILGPALGKNISSVRVCIESRFWYFRFTPILFEKCDLCIHRDVLADCIDVFIQSSILFLYLRLLNAADHKHCCDK